MVCAPFHNIKEADILNEKAPEHCIAFHFPAPPEYQGEFIFIVFIVILLTNPLDMDEVLEEVYALVSVFFFNTSHL